MYWMEEEGVGILKEVRSSLGSDNPDMMRVIHSGLVLDKLIEQSIPEFTQMREQLAHLEDRLKEKAREIKSISTVEDERRHLIERLMPKDEASATPKVLFEAGIGHLFPELSAHQEIYDQTQYSGSDETHPAKILPADATLAERLQGGLRGSHRDK
jgi:hypothetical protein